MNYVDEIEGMSSVSVKRDTWTDSHSLVHVAARRFVSYDSLISIVRPWSRTVKLKVIDNS